MTATTDIIARRQLERDGRVFEILIEKPQQDETGNYTCSWSMVDDSGGAVLSLKTYGVDSAQALIFAVLIIGDRVSDESHPFTHYGVEGTGFPRHFDTGKPDMTAWCLPRIDLPE